LISPVGIPEQQNRDLSQAPFYVRFLFGTIRGAWSKGYSNFNITNTIGRKYTTDFYCNSRYRPGMSWYNKDLVADQMYYNIINGNVSGGGYSHTTLLKPGAYARSPLIHRFSNTFSKIPSVTFIYGEADWMDIRPAEEYRDALHKGDREQNEIGKKITIYKVNGAGHTLTIDNPIGTADAIYRSITQKERGLLETKELGLIPLMLDCGIQDKLSPGMKVEGQIGRWKNDEWREGELVRFNPQDGTCKIRWKNEGTVTSNFPAYRLRVPSEISKNSTPAQTNVNTDNRKTSSSL
jgi:hypothetical protein